VKGYLLDTNVLSELRRGPRMDAHVRAWFEGAAASSLHSSVLVFGEIRKGEARLRLRDAPAADAIMAWRVSVMRAFEDRILPVTGEVAETWGSFDPKQLVSPIDGLIAATALVHELTLVTRNVKDVERTGVPCLNPFLPPPARAPSRRRSRT